MTQDEFEILRLRMRLSAQTTLFNFVADVLRLHYGSQPEQSRLVLVSALRQQLLDKQAELEAGLFVAGADPAMSDLQSSEWIESFTDLSNEFVKTIEAGMTDKERRHFKSLGVDL